MGAWTATTRRRVRALLGDVVVLDSEQEDDAPSLEAMAREAKSLLPLLAENRVPVKALPGKSRKADRAERRERHRAETAAIYEAVSKRAQIKCEACGGSGRAGGAGEAGKEV